ncbi:MAG TPA: rhodanese-like domain-containing protein [Gammaproteobacteria bacterium]|nr:rhodanese-like domain-containing protein [Gammaproteobacteria bacterium]
MIRLIKQFRASLAVILIGFSTTSMALEVQLDKNRDSLETIHNGHVVKVQRVQDLKHTISGFFARTSHKCPPHCVQPTQIDPRVKTFTELDIFDFMENDVVAGTGVLIDARLPEWNKKGTIPGSINVPFTVLEASPSDPALVDTLYKLGVRKRGEVGTLTRLLEKMGFLNGDLKTDHWDFSQAKKLVLFCNGPWCGQSPRAIKALLKLHYPPERLAYYRGGLQLWQLYGLTTIVP